jgi:Ni/Fe-hydrogenase b-type cytochrome subunit
MKTLFLNHKRAFTALGLGLLTALLAFGIVLANRPAAPAAQPSALHPPVALLDADGQNVLASGQPVSTMQTCGACHDTEFIVSHSFHADLGLSDYQAQSGNWNASSGTFGKWDPLTYRYLSQDGDERLDLSTAEFLMEFGERVPGGGPATTSRTGLPLTSLAPDASDPEASILNPETGQPEGWDWAKSGVMEMNCFLCHLNAPDTAARAEEIKSGKFGWANTATLNGSGIVRAEGAGWGYNPEAFNENGELDWQTLGLQDPTNANCATCHGLAHTDKLTPLTYTGCSLDEHQTATTGQIVTPQKISASGMNISGKNDLTYAWDIHAERALKCTDCHYALNNPAQAQRMSQENPDHLTYDPRRLEISDYLLRPNHDFARGQSAQFNVAPDLKATMRRCDSCHDAQQAHSAWLPYTERHMQVLDCESCHIPQMHAPAIQAVDWTVITPAGEAISQCRGVEGDPDSQASLMTGFTPVLLQRENVDGRASLTTYNLISAWYWVYDDANGNPRPVRLADLEAVYLQNGAYSPETVAAFDSDGDGKLTSIELRIDNEGKQGFVASALSALGLQNPRIEGQIQPYSINHNVVRGAATIKDCETCHTADSRVTAPMKLAAYAPGGVTPAFVTDTNVRVDGLVQVAEDGSLHYQPQNEARDVYVFGHDRVDWVDWLGAAAFAGAVLGVAGHGTFRYINWLKRPKHLPATKRVHMYEAYERFWHWLQTVTIVVLLLTGLVIHRPDVFGAFSFRYMVTVHNVMAAILVINALLSLFWHLTTGEVRQYIPRPRGFFDDTIVQIKFYIGGIFKGEPHPFEKRRDKKLNPLQQATYFGLLTVLLPLQIVTGALMWGVQKFPQISTWFGGLPVLAPFHSLIAWLLAAFIVGHVYLTTTGATPVEAIRAMVTGWEEVESHEKEQE